MPEGWLGLSQPGRTGPTARGGRQKCKFDHPHPQAVQVSITRWSQERRAHPASTQPATSNTVRLWFFQAMLLESINTRTILIRLPLDSSAMCPSTQHPLANVSQELRGPTIVPSAVLATDTFRFQNHFSLVRVCDSSPPWLSPYFSGHYF